MVQVSYPGVYIEEVSSGVHTITGVSTSIGAFFGRASMGPLNEPIRILSVADYIRNFGQPHPSSDLAQSVRQFFDNGGTDCYVVRLARNAVKSAVTLLGLDNAQSVLTFTAKAEGAWGDTVRLAVDYKTPNPADTFNLSVIQEQAGAVVTTESFTNLSMRPGSPRFAPTFLSQSSNLVDVKAGVTLGDPTLPGSFMNTIGNSFAGFSEGRRPLGATAADVQTLLLALLGAANPQTSFNISVNEGTPVLVNLTGWVVPATIAQIQTGLAGFINTALASVTPVDTVQVTISTVANIGELLRITSASGSLSSVRVFRAASSDLSAALMLGTDQGGIEATRWSNFRPAPTASLVRIGNPATPGDLTTINELAALKQSDITQITIDGVVVPLNVAPNSLQTTVASDPWLKSKAGDSAATGDQDGTREKLRIIAAAINANTALPWSADVWGHSLALLAKGGPVNTRPGSVTTGNGNFDGGVILNVRQYTLGGSGTGSFSTGGVAGSDGSAPTVTEYLGNQAAQTGFYALDPVDLFNLMVLPGDDEVDDTAMAAIWGPASNYCQSRRAFLLIDPPGTWTTTAGRAAVVGNTVLVNNLRATVIKDYSAVFYPNLIFNDRGLVRSIGPSGALAGLFARTDSTRGVWKAPAGVEADIRNILDLEVNLTDRENGVLNKLGVNCSRKFPSGFVHWGARTLDGSDDIGSEWKYIPIRRLALFIEESLFRGTKWVVFEPNDEPLWAKIRLNIRAFMLGLFRQGAFQGSTPDTAFYVKCDGETTTQADRNLGIVNIEIGFAPLKPAEFVVIRIQQIAGDL